MCFSTDDGDGGVAAQFDVDSRQGPDEGDAEKDLIELEGGGEESASF